MLIKHDYSYIRSGDKKLIDNGYGKIGVYAFILDPYYSEEQKTENLRQAQILTDNERVARGDKYRLGFYELLMPVLKALHGNHFLYQFEGNADVVNGRDRYHFGDYDLFFYSNCGWNKKDYFDHVSLSLNEKKSNEENAIIIYDVLDVLSHADISCASCRVQYHAILNTPAIEQAAETAFAQLEEKGFVQYGGMDGKFKRLVEGQSSVYGFFKKNSKSRYYPVEPRDVLLQTL